MIQQLSARFQKATAFFLLTLFYCQTVLAGIPHGNAIAMGNREYNPRKQASLFGGMDNNKMAVSGTTVKQDKAAAAPTFSIANNQAFFGGPTQPEMQAFSSVNASNMVDLFSGDFSYNIPLLDVGGYPVNIAYRGGITMDQEASWVGLGWNINPGTITRNMRGLPDDFNGTADSITKTTSIKENKTVGVTAGADLELIGLPKIGSANLGVFNNNYKGWGIETGLNASINSGSKGAGSLTGGLSLTNNSQDGLTIVPSLSVRLSQKENDNKSGFGESFSISAPYNSRTGLRALQMSAGINQSKVDKDNQTHSGANDYASSISFANPSFTPTISMPYTSRQFSFTAKVGLENKPSHPNFFVSGYVSTQTIDPGDQVSKLPAFGYLNFQNTNNDASSLLDYNREKEIAYREKPAMPHIGVPSYTYDVFSITGEGTGGMFRPYRGDIGYVYDHLMKTKDKSDRLSVDLGFGDVFHGGVDLNVNRSYTQSSPWIDENVLGRTVRFRKSAGLFESAYFRNPGEKSINSKAFYDAIGGDDVVAPDLYQASVSSATITATNFLNRYKNKSFVGKTAVNEASVVKQQRDKRTQVITYLTAKDAETVSTSKYIESYQLNSFNRASCLPVFNINPQTDGTGLYGEYFNNTDFTGAPTVTKVEGPINGYWLDAPEAGINGDYFSIRWTGKIKAPVTGAYILKTSSDDGVRLWLNDSLLIDDWTLHPELPNTATVNLVAGEFYKVRLEFFDQEEEAAIRLFWSYPSQSEVLIPQKYMYPPSSEIFSNTSGIVTRERRVNAFRKPNHISEIDVLNADGRKYQYGIPVYNLKQKETTFAIDKSKGNAATGLAGYVNGSDNTTSNTKGKDNYFSSEEIPAYAHSFLLTGIVSPDYVDLTGDGISDDDLGDAVKFNYTRTAGIANPYEWRAPYVTDSVTYNEGLKSDSRDDKGNYVYGKKELWYLNSIQSKNMVAAFFLEDRQDVLEISETGAKTASGKTKLLRKIALYNKAEFLLKDTFATPVKTVYFEYSYELCRGVNAGVNPSLYDTGKLTLKKIWFSYNGNNKGQQNPYVFKYHANNPRYNIKSYDRWGNYKNPANNPSGLNNAEYPYTLQDSTISADNVAAWTLQEIKLPSGGRIKVDYESDDYAYVQNRRAMQMFQIKGFGSSNFLPSGTNNALYAKGNVTNPVADNLFVFVQVNQTVASNTDVLKKYLDGIDKLYFKLNVQVPGDKWGSGYENIPCYADVESYGYMNANTIWIKLKGIDLDGNLGGKYSPLAKAATQFLKLNLGSKAYPGSETGDDINVGDAVKILFSQVDNILNTIRSFDINARSKGWMKNVDLSKSFVRLTCPTYKKMGGGARVKRVSVYDNWNAMTGQKEAKYGQEYTYTTTKEIDGKKTVISSGVASYEPGLGGEENPFHLPIEYIERASALAPVTMGYTEEPLGESFFPSASVGYSKVRVRSINTEKTRSANGYEETGFYTAYDFPTLVDRSMIDENTKKRFKPALSNFLRINARHYLTISQGFKVELNDMHGKMRSQASYPETDPDHPISYTENFYRIENQNADVKQLANTVMAMAPDGSIDTAALIGKDAELMLDMREQRTVVNGINANINSEFFSFGLPPFLLLLSFLNLAQREETQFRSAAATKIIQRYGILDSVVHIDKGSKVSTKNMLYDSETGDVLLSRTQNEFNDPIYNFSYPAHWAYEGMGMAYKNIGVTLDKVFIRNGKITSGLPSGKTEADFFASGDEIFINSKPKTGTGADACNDAYATFPVQGRIWAIDANVVSGGTKSIYFIDKDGQAFTGNDISLTITRSGRKNMGGGVGAVSTLANPLIYNSGTHQYSIQLNTDSKVVNASVAKFKQLWKVADKKKMATDTYSNCPTGYGYSNTLNACVADTTVIVGDSIHTCLIEKTNQDYSCCGSFVYSSFNVYNSVFNREQINYSNAFWKSGYDSKCGYTPPNSRIAETDSSINNTDSLLTGRSGTSSPVYTTGPMNRSAVWACSDSTVANNQWFGFTVPINITSAGTYYFGMGADNLIRITIDGVLFRLDTNISHTNENFKIWQIYPKYLSAGVHQVKMEGLNREDVAGFGVEIYNNTKAQLDTATSYSSLNLLFSTKQLIDQKFPSSYSCPSGYGLIDNGGVLACRISDSVPTFQAGTCYSAITDTVVNPYTYGILGNFRADTTYTYYGARTETDPSSATNIRRFGTFSDFTPFWSFNSGQLKAQPDTTRWVWNSTMTLFNKRGFELENKDPLGRYNAGLYGYNQTLPTAVVQNSQYREAAFEGFEDYSYNSNTCDTGCSVGRHFDFGFYNSSIDSTQSHTGKYSLKVPAGTDKGIAANTGTGGFVDPSLVFATNTNCGATRLKSIKTDSTAILPIFSPLNGKKVLFSAWVKEIRDCKCESYTGNSVVMVITTSAGSSSYTFYPKGNIIEGWQRYENIVNLPSNATSISISLKATGTSDVYFDDIRLHPFNANMKSFVYNPINLRLMSELDENNYATFYEYDDDGTLIRVKKETERGIKTIKETRSALRKEDQ